MYSIKDILTGFYHAVNYKGSAGSFSLPFVVADNGVGKIAIFKYLKENNQVTQVENVYTINCETCDVDEYEGIEDQDLLPITINPKNWGDGYTQKENYDKYLTLLDNFFRKGEVDFSEFGRLFNLLEYSELIPIYKYYGAEFIFNKNQ